MTNKKIWILNHYASDTYRDRAGRHYSFAKELLERGYNPTIFCATTIFNSDETVETNGQKLAVKQCDGITYVFVKTTQAKGNGLDRVRNMGLFYRNLFPATKTYAKKNGWPDVILASSVHPLTMVAGIQIGKRKRIPVICEVRDLWPEAIFSFGKAKEKSLLGKVLVAGEHWIYRNANAMIFTKEGDTDYLKERNWTTAQGGDINLNKCYYINNGVDIESYRQRIDKEILKDDDLTSSGKFNVIYCGTIRPVNNVENLLDTAKIISKKEGYDDIQFLVYGDGVELPRLRERVESEHIKNVHLKGFVEKKYIPYVLSKSGVNILNYSQTEYNWSRGNSSNKLFEYMASGKPIISTVRMGYSIIKNYNCGTELEEDTPTALANAIIRFHDMESTKYDEMGQNAAKGVEDFDFTNLVDRLEIVIDSVQDK